MPQLCRFKSGMSPTDVYVNPTQVRMIWEWDAGNTVLGFDKEHSATVAEPIAQVAQKLDKALASS